MRRRAFHAGDYTERGTVAGTMALWTPHQFFYDNLVCAFNILVAGAGNQKSAAPQGAPVHHRVRHYGSSPLKKLTPRKYPCPDPKAPPYDSPGGRAPGGKKSRSAVDPDQKASQEKRRPLQTLEGTQRATGPVHPSGRGSPLLTLYGSPDKPWLGNPWSLRPEIGLGSEKGPAFFPQSRVESFDFFGIGAPVANR